MFENLPKIIHGYEFIQPIGKGGFSSVYLVKSLNYNQLFVAKVQNIPTNTKTRQFETFKAEIDSLAALNHPNIIKLYDHFEEDQTYFIILEYCPNGSLNDLIHHSSKRGLHHEKFRWYAKQIISALNFIHKQNMAHHDIKPHNILLDMYGRPKIADFGLCLQHIDDEEELLKNSKSLFSGSLYYLAPEIIQHLPFDPQKADMWSLGVMFVVMLTGKRPFHKNCSCEQLKKNIINCSYEIPKVLPQQITEIIKKLIVSDPSRRLSCEELLKLPFFKKQSFNNYQSGGFLKGATSSDSFLNFNMIKPMTMNAFPSYENLHLIENNNNKLDSNNNINVNHICSEYTNNNINDNNDNNNNINNCGSNKHVSTFNLNLDSVCMNNENDNDENEEFIMKDDECDIDADASPLNYGGDYVGCMRTQSFSVGMGLDSERDKFKTLSFYSSQQLVGKKKITSRVHKTTPKSLLTFL